MAVADLLEAQPAHLPPGYRFQRKLRGRLFEGFRGDDEQVILVYGRGWSDAGAYRPLLVYVSPSTNGAELFSTEEKAGQPLELGVDGTRTVYHDGRWELGPGFDARTPGDVNVTGTRATGTRSRSCIPAASTRSAARGETASA